MSTQKQLSCAQTAHFKSLKSKRKIKKCLTLAQKQKLLTSIDKGANKSDLAKQYQIDRTTISHLIKNRKKIEEASNLYSQKYSRKMKAIKSSKHLALNKAVWTWFAQTRESNPSLPISVEMVKLKANSFHKMLCSKNDFQASNGWYWRWSQKHGIRSLKAGGLKHSAPVEEVEPFNKSLLKIMKREQLQLAQIYNFDETACFYKRLPTRSLASHLEKSTSTFKQTKERITISTCYNVTGEHKLKLQVIGKSQRPRCFRNGRPDGVVYQASTKAWQTTRLFEEWFHKHFVPEVKEYQQSQGFNGKALLLIDRAPSHIELESNDGMIRTIFLPANTTAILQPCDQNLILPLKVSYRKLLLEDLMMCGMDDPEAYLKTFNIKQGLNLMEKAWKELKIPVLIYSWRKILKDCNAYQNLLKVTEEVWEPEDDLPLAELTLRADFDPNAWNEQDIDEAIGLEMTDEEIVDYALNHPAEDLDTDSASETETSILTVDVPDSEPLEDPEILRSNHPEEHKQALKYLTALEQYYQQQEDGENGELTVHKLKNELMEKLKKSK